MENVWTRIASRTRDRLRAGLRALDGPLAPQFYEGLEELLVACDLGPVMAVRLTEAVRQRQPRSLEEARRDLELATLAEHAHPVAGLDLLRLGELDRDLDECLRLKPDQEPKVSVTADGS